MFKLTYTLIVVAAMLLLSGFVLTPQTIFAQNKVVVIPLFGDEGITCSGTRWSNTGQSANGRWCDNGDGTVTDLLGYNGKGKGLVWLKDAGWGGQRAWRVNVEDSHNDAHTRAGTLSSGTAGLTDGSDAGDWRLPTRNELAALTNGTHKILSGTPGPFTDVEHSSYWSSSTESD
jgi:hypothetical protein